MASNVSVYPFVVHVTRYQVTCDECGNLADYETERVAEQWREHHVSVHAHRDARAADEVDVEHLTDDDITALRDDFMSRNPTVIAVVDDEPPTSDSL